MKEGQRTCHFVNDHQLLISMRFGMTSFVHFSIQNDPQFCVVVFAGQLSVCFQLLQKFLRMKACFPQPCNNMAQTVGVGWDWLLVVGGTGGWESSKCFQMNPSVSNNDVIGSTSFMPG